MSDGSPGQKLSDAAFAGDTDQIDALLHAGVDINAKDADGFTALHRSCVTGVLTVINFLVQRGADVNCQDSYGDSPMHYACFCGHVDAVNALIAAGADPIRPSKDGKTPMQSAEEEGHANIVALLSSHIGSGASSAPKPPAAGPGGLDFSQGVIMEGELRKKRANLVVKWRRKYYVLSKTYAALFFWTGNRHTVDGVIKKVRFETFLSVRHHKDKHNGRRFDIRVLTGRTMELLASTNEEALQWVRTLNRQLGHVMAVHRVQTAWRAHRARKQLSRMREQRSAAVKRLVSATSNAHLKDLGPDGVLLEGPLKKRNQKGFTRYFNAFRTRYFVLNVREASLLYYESRAKRKLGVRARGIPFLHFYIVRQLRDKSGRKTKKFILRVTSGRQFEFEAKNEPEAENWVMQLLRVLPTDNVAALRIQSVWRRYRAKMLFERMRVIAADRTLNSQQRYGKPFEVLDPAATKITKVARGRIVRKKYLAAKAKRDAEAEKAALRKKQRVYLKQGREKEGTGEVGAGTTSRLARLRALKQKKESANAASPTAEQSPWTKLIDEESGNPYWYNASTGESTWDDPTGGDAGAAAAAGTPASEWEERVDDEGNRFYVNLATGESQWEKPEGFVGGEDDAESDWSSDGEEEAGEEEDVLEQRGDWTKHVDPTSGETFYVNVVTGESVWDAPEEWREVEDKPQDEWQELVDPDSGRTYYFNPATGERSWTDPRKVGDAVAGEMDSSDDDESADDEVLDTDWEELIDERTNKRYYFNETTQESRWMPPGLGDEYIPDGSEMWAVSSFINHVLAPNGEVDPNVPESVAQYLPLDPASEELPVLQAIQSGVLLCVLLNFVKPDTVDMRVVDVAPEGENYEAAASDNITLALAAAQSIGCFVGEIEPEDIMTGAPMECTDMLWQMMKLWLLDEISVRKNQSVMQLLKEDEELDALLQLSPEGVLMRWVNYQLAAAGETKAHENFGEGFKDCMAYYRLTKLLCTEAVDTIPATEDEARNLPVEDLAHTLLSCIYSNDVPAWLSVEGVTSTNPRMHISLCALLFRARPNLGDTEDAVGNLPERRTSVAQNKRRASSVQIAGFQKELAEMMSSVGDEGQSREMRTYMMWLNSLNIKNTYVHDLSTDLRDGVVLLKVFEHIDKGIVDWRKGNKKPNNKYRKIENCNYVVDLGRAMDFSLVNISGLDMVDGNPKLILAFMWQLMRFHSLRVLSSLAFDGFEADESDVLRWAQKTVAEYEEAHGKPTITVDSFQDSRLSNSIFLLQLLDSIRPIVNWSLVHEDDSPASKQNNAKYLISVARKMGAQVFCTWEDIVECKPKMITLFLASVMAMQNKPAAATGGGSGRSSIAGPTAAGLLAPGSDDEWSDDEDEVMTSTGGGGGGALM